MRKQFYTDKHIFLESIHNDKNIAEENAEIIFQKLYLMMTIKKCFKFTVLDF